MPREHHQAKKRQLAAKPDRMLQKVAHACKDPGVIVSPVSSPYHQKIKAELFFSWFQGSVSPFEILGLPFKGFNH